MGRLDRVVPGNKAMPRGRLRTENREAIKEGCPMGVTSGISDDQEDGHNQGVLWYNDPRSTARRGW